ncbi:MAG TPA: HIT family protein [Candidatus Saccharimonadales bacterium]|nr:HIT family protein [Candidatus Saccharimonadales bacterium]
MPIKPECPFCNTVPLEKRTIRVGELCRSIVSVPRFQEGHCLVIPNRHITTVAELEPNESVEIMQELGRLSVALDKGYGTGIMQKYQPLQPDNGVKVSHLHFHVFPRLAEELRLFPVPEPNSFEAFHTPDETEITAWAQSLK